MKLLYCPSCADAVTMLNDERACMCGACRGRYVGITKMVVSGPAVQVIAFNNLEFVPVRDRAVKATPGKPKDDYHLKANEFEAWMFGPNALAVTKATEQTHRDRSELEANAVIKHYDAVNHVANYVRQMTGDRRRRFLEDVAEEVERLELLSTP